MDINIALNEVLVKLFKSITTIEEHEIQSGKFKNVTTNDMHVLDAIGMDKPKNMTSVAKSLGVTTGTLTISVNSLVKKNYVTRVRSEEDRRVVLISLTEKGREAYMQHKQFRDGLVTSIVKDLSEEEKVILQKALKKISDILKK